MISPRLTIFYILLVLYTINVVDSTAHAKPSFGLRRGPTSLTSGKRGRRDLAVSSLVRGGSQTVQAATPTYTWAKILTTLMMYKQLPLSHGLLVRGGGDALPAITGPAVRVRGGDAKKAAGKAVRYAAYGSELGEGKLINPTSRRAQPVLLLIPHTTIQPSGPWRRRQPLPPSTV